MDKVILNQMQTKVVGKMKLLINPMTSKENDLTVNTIVKNHSNFEHLKTINLYFF